MQTQEIGQYIIKPPTNVSPTQNNNTGDKLEDDTITANYEHMEQVEEFELDTTIHSAATEDAPTNNHHHHRLVP